MPTTDFTPAWTFRERLITASSKTKVIFNFPDFKAWEYDIKEAAAKSLKESVKKVENSAKRGLSGVSERTGALKKSIVSTAKIYKNGVWAGVGVDSSYKEVHGGKVVKPSKYAHLIEAGFQHYPDGSRIEAKPFLSPAVNQNGGREGICADARAAIIATKSKALKGFVK